jgi:hypothetical protein
VVEEGGGGASKTLEGWGDDSRGLFLVVGELYPPPGESAVVVVVLLGLYFSSMKAIVSALSARKVRDCLVYVHDKCDVT